ncbi:MAG: GntR family transcriptional regulator [Faecalibacterium sp.]
MPKIQSEPTTRLGGAVISSQIAKKLLQELQEGHFSNATTLPAEVELAVTYHVSRTVIRDALSELERAGYLERVRGIGTLINRGVLNMESRIDQKLEYYPLIQSIGGYPHADRIQIYPMRAEADLANSLEIPLGSEVICIQKRILSDATPVIYSVDYLPRSLFGTRDYSRIDLTPSVFDVLEQECGQQVSSNLAHIKASYGNPTIRAAMQLAEDDALLLLDETCYNRTCKPIMRSFSYYTNFFDFSIVRKMF